MLNILYINLKHRVDRNENIIRQFGDISGLNLIHFDAIEYNPGAIGCSLSHIECIKYAKNQNWKNVIILEDDFELLVSKDFFANKINNLIQKDFDVLLLSGFVRENFDLGGEMCRIKNTQTTIGYIVKSHYYDKLLHNYETGLNLLKSDYNKYNIYGLDQYWKILQNEDNWYISNPILGKQLTGYSDIEKKTKNYDEYYLKSNFNKILVKENPKIHFITFGTTPGYSRSLEILNKEAKESGYFDSITIYTQKDLPGGYDELIRSSRRGFGYWFWKPIILLKKMKEVKEGDIVIYADAGCGISTTENAKNNFKRWIEDVIHKEPHRLAFQLTHMEENYTKEDLFHYLDCIDDIYKKTNQFIGGIQIMVNIENNRYFIEKWLEIIKADKYHYVDDSPSVKSNISTFKGHRHDQSIVSLLFKKYGAIVYQDHWKDNNFPIIALRRK